MHTTLIFAAFLAISAAGAGEPALRATRAPNVRPLTESAAGLLADAVRLSAVVRGLVHDLDRSDVVVYVRDSMSESRGVPAFVEFVSYAAGTRYVMVKVDRWGLPPWERVALLAHELQHAVEIAEAPEVKDSESLARLYARIGWQCGTRRFETDRARATGTMARDQLQGLYR